MNKLLAILWAIGLSLSVMACAARGNPTPAVAKAPDPVTVRVWREADITLHADTEFPPEVRIEILEAAARWQSFTNGHARIAVAFDLDFGSIASLKEHRDHNRVTTVLSTNPIAQDIEKDTRAKDPRYRPLAATITTTNGPIRVFLIGDRLKRSQYPETLTHEFGHVLGLPDLPTTGAIMSGVQVAGADSRTEFTPEDTALCRASRLCD